MRKVMVFGAFDILHKGHLFYFSKAKEFGDHLVVVIARDETIRKVKSRNSYNSENDRLEEVQKCEIVNKAILGNIEDKYQVIIDEKPDILVFGYDQQSFNIGIKEELSKRGITNIEIKTIKESFEPEKYKSSIIYNSKN